MIALFRAKIGITSGNGRKIWQIHPAVIFFSTKNLKNIAQSNSCTILHIQILTEQPAAAKKLWPLQEMETTGGEPDVVGHDKNTDEYIFYDCSPESPKGRRSICYDQKALNSRKEHKPENSAVAMAAEMGIEILTEEQYRALQQLGNFDAKTS